MGRRVINCECALAFNARHSWPLPPLFPICFHLGSGIFTGVGKEGIADVVGASPNSTLLTHLYSYFGVLLGCTKVGTDGFPAYGGEASMYEVHK